ncbi:acetyl-CoA acetyltransferase [Streptomyces sp. NBC_00328]|uniref:acetyl-CoA acetyltransferase n=1 Tax=Streptomyces sp. NBC_00328 TaxID=2903646 RepID=UPI002E2BC675|nr:acetyl-CoA acetyltransferase [Streptomyces sp. NBC_00328]
MTTGVAVVGVAEADLGVSDLPALALLAQGVTRALDDAGLTLAQVDGLATSGTGRFPATQAADYLGITPAWTDSTFAGGSAFEMYVARAAQAIAAGQCTTAVIAYGSDQRSGRSRSLTGPLDPASPETQFEAPAGPLYPLSHYAMTARRYLHVHGHSRRALAEVAVAARAWALLNPAAHRHGAGPLTVDEVLASPMISSPLTKADCCLVTDGGGAIVLTSLDRARDLRRTPVRVLGYGEATTHTGSAGPDDLLANPGAYASAARAYRHAGVRPADIDVVQVYDSFTITTLLSLEALGLCGPGEAADLVADGRIRPGGALPLNTSGGGLSYGHPGMFGVFLLIEAVRQLRGECGARQIPGARTAVAHGTGGILSTHATVVLAREDTGGAGSSPPGTSEPWTGVAELPPGAPERRPGSPEPPRTPDPPRPGTRPPSGLTGGTHRGTQTPPWDGPLPAPADAVTRAWWDATRTGRLTVQRCDDCRHAQHPPRVLCTACGATRGLRLVPVAGTAVLDTFTVVHRAPPGRPVPYALGRTRLTEGPVLLAPLVGDHEALLCGQSLRLTWRALPDGRMLPVFRPTGDPAASWAAVPGTPFTDPPHAAPPPPAEPEP